MSRDRDEEHRRHMRLALAEAERAGRIGEVPVGAVVVLAGEVVGRGANSPILHADPTAHAEILALRDAAARVGNYRLSGANLYCTVEPCLMCLGAALHARVATVVHGAADPKIGATTALEALRQGGAELNHCFEVIPGVLAEEATALLTAFFRERRVRGATELGKGEVPKWP